MKKVAFIITFVFVFACVDSKTETQTVELSCGQCQFDLNSQDGCDLAVRIDDIAYFVDGANIDDFGDAHDKNTGFCEVIRTAQVSGRVENNRFKINTIELNE